MYNYSITHNAGNYQVVFVEMEAGFSAHIFDAKSNCITVLHAKSEHATFDACLAWASTNIRGGFQLTSFQLSDLTSEVTATA